MPSDVCLRLLDALELRWGDGPGVRLPIGKEAELLALLAYRPAGVPRAEIAALLWPEAPEPAARHRLRTLLVELRHRGEGLLDIARDRVCLAPGVATDLTSDPPSEGFFAPGLEGEWLDEARDDLTYRRASRLVLDAQTLASEEPLAALNLAERALRLAPDSLAAEALIARLRARPRASEIAAPDPPFLSPRDRARLACARAPLRYAAGELRAPAAEADRLLASLASGDPLRPPLLVARAGYAFEAGDYAACERHAREAEVLGVSGAAAVWVTVWRARAAYGSGDFARVVPAARLAARLALECGETNAAVLAECMLGAAEILRGRPERADDHLVRARAVAGGDLYLVARCENVAGWAALASGASVPARRHFERARAGGGDDRRFASNVLQGLARAHAMAGNAVASRAHLDEAARLLEGTDLDLPYVGIVSALADLDEAEGRFEAALESHRRSLARRTASGDRLGLFTSLSGLGRLTLRLGRPAEAVRLLREAYALHTALFGELRLAVPALPLADALLASGRTREATSLVARSLESLKDEPPEARAGNAYPAEIPVLAERLRPLVKI